MSGRELRIEEILGRPVHAKNGRRIGRLEEIRAERRGTGLVVVEYRVGTGALLERLAFHALRLGERAHREYCVPWDKLDLADPRALRLLCEVGDLERVESPEEKRET